MISRHSKMLKHDIEFGVGNDVGCEDVSIMLEILIEEDNDGR